MFPFQNQFEESHASGQIEVDRDHVLVGKERHVPAQESPDSGGTPMRAIRTNEFLLIRNFTPERWPAGTGNWKNAFITGCWYADVDSGPTKTYMIANQNKDDDHHNKFELAFGKRPEFELYDLSKDPAQLKNVAADPAYEKAKTELNKRMTSELTAMGDPRILGNGEEVFGNTPYFGTGPKHPDFRKK